MFIVHEQDKIMLQNVHSRQFMVVATFNAVLQSSELMTKVQKACTVACVCVCVNAT